MNAFLGYALAVMWVAWLVYWWVSAAGAKAIARTVAWQHKIVYGTPLLIAAVLLADRHLPGFLDLRVIAEQFDLVVAGVALTALGLGFTVWARIALGTNWSGDVTVKHDHELIRTGPYALARHPIYTGLGLAFLGTALAVGELRGAIAVLIAWGSFWYKLSLEERFMTETFGALYADYKKNVKAVIPFVF
jgi:protein-S-isoprenylcysteine O-methyltransferase Ste14